MIVPEGNGPVTFAIQCGLRSPLLFAAIHRDHIISGRDTERDIHSPITKGFMTA
jgi:hypothetical protein